MASVALGRLTWMLAALLLLATLLAALPARAEETLRIEVGKLEILRLRQPAGTVIATNPGIIDVAVEKPTLVFLFGAQPGETELLIMNGDYEEIYHTTVVVVRPKERHVSIQRGPDQQAHFSCNPECLPVAAPSDGVGESAGGDANGGGGAAAGGDSQPKVPAPPGAAVDLGGANATETSDTVREQDTSEEPPVATVVEE
ncbi:pilus assembly protein N-terminal domain-containing protein [Roseospirillum parvum]|uniref:pilus assembly protein N-terminal domain-containing protein n=1 Tax=Roseospirillum parvum TaxID=83401 RepID=UPI0015A10BE1|nr:pilus assembly protein N-terminal domain-containing protein [Roseospirillum parvum]